MSPQKETFAKLLDKWHRYGGGEVGEWELMKSIINVKVISLYIHFQRIYDRKLTL